MNTINKFYFSSNIGILNVFGILVEKLRKHLLFLFVDCCTEGTPRSRCRSSLGLGLAYWWLQTQLSWKLHSKKYGNHFQIVTIAQLVNNIALTVFLFLCILLNYMYIRNVAFLSMCTCGFHERNIFLNLYPLTYHSRCNENNLQSQRS